MNRTDDSPRRPHESGDTPQRLIDAAGPIFAEKGLEATGVREICRRAGANIAAVNFHFRTKEGLYIEAVRRAYQSCACAAPLPTWPPGTPAAQRLREFLGTFLLRVVEHPGPAWHTLLIWREVAQPTVACAEFVREFVRPTFALLLDILRDLTPPDLPGQKLHLLGASIVGQCLHYQHARHVIPLLIGEAEARALTVGQLAGHIAEFSLAALERLYPHPGGRGRRHGPPHREGGGKA